MRTAKLKDIADIRTGIFANAQTDGDIVYLQARDFDDEGYLRTALHPELQRTAITDKHLIRPNDLLFAAKGTKNFATVFNRYDVKAVASTTFFVLRLARDYVLPEFLAWSLNGPAAQGFLHRNATNSTVFSISKSLLGELELPTPSLEKQRIILEITNLEKKELELTQRIAEIRHQRIQQIINNAIKY